MDPQYVCGGGGALKFELTSPPPKKKKKKKKKKNNNRLSLPGRMNWQAKKKKKRSSTEKGPHLLVEQGADNMMIMIYHFW